MRLRNWLIILLLIGLLGVLLATWQRGTTPENFPLAKATERYYPDGSKMRIEFLPIPAGTEIQAVKTLVQPTSKKISDAVAADKFIQSSLPSPKDPTQPFPKKLSIRKSSTARLGKELPPVAFAMLLPTVRRSILPKWFVRFELQYENIPLSNGSDALAIVGTDGKVLYLRQRNLPLEIDATKPTVDSEEAIAVAKKHFLKDAGASLFSVVDTDRPIKQIWVNPQDRKGKLAWTFIARSRSWMDYLRGRSKSHALRYWVSAVGGADVLHRENMVSHAQGTVTGKLWEGSSASPPSQKPLPLGNLYVCGLTQDQTWGDCYLREQKNDMTNIVLTDPTGHYELSNTGNTTIIASFQGPYANVQLEGNPGWFLSKGLSNSGGGTNPTINFPFQDSTPEKLAYVTAFYQINGIYEYVISEDGLKNTDLKNLTQQVRVNVNSDECDAETSSQGIIYLGKEGSRCNNTAFRDVIAHEYGHVVDYWIGGILDQPYSEGFGDALAMLLTKDACVGRGLYIDVNTYGACLRNYDDPSQDIKWPDDDATIDANYQACVAKDGLLYCKGRIYGGFVWKLIQLLKNGSSENEAIKKAYDTATTLIIGAAANDPSSIEDAVCQSFLVDAVSGDPNSGPYHQQLENAADALGIPRPPKNNCARPRQPQ